MPGLLRSSVIASGTAALVGLTAVTALVLLSWASESGSRVSAATALQTAGQVWLFSHHAPLRTSVGSIGMVPLGLLALPVLLLMRAGQAVGREVSPVGPAQFGRALAAMLAPYLLIAVLVMLACAGAPLRTGQVSAMAAVILLAGLSAGIGLLRATGSDAVGMRPPGWVAPALRAGGVALGTLLAFGAVLVAVSLIRHASTLRALVAGVGGNHGALGGVTLLLLCVLYAPNAVVAAISYVCGSGFAVGTGTSVTALGAHLGAVPAFPLLAALPSSPTAPAAATLAYAAPLLAGVALGVVVATQLPWVDWLRLGGSALAAGACAGAAAGVLALLAAGPVGSGRLAAVGPSAWQLGLSCGGELIAIGVATALLTRLIRRRMNASATVGEPVAALTMTDGARD